MGLLLFRSNKLKMFFEWLLLFDLRSKFKKDSLNGSNQGFSLDNWKISLEGSSKKSLKVSDLSFEKDFLH